MNIDETKILDLVNQLNRNILDKVKGLYIGKNEIIDLIGICLVAGENLFLYGPPGTAKSALIHEVGKSIEGETFDYLLTRFTEPNELFGPFDIRKLREGELVTNTEGMLPEASIVFLDELLNANSAILNSLLMVLNEKIFRRGRETRKLPLLIALGASNRLPEEETLKALFDRFLLRVNCNYVDEEDLTAVLKAGWELEKDDREYSTEFSIEDIRYLNRVISQVDLSEILESYTNLVQRLRNAGIAISDRRAVKFQKVIAASAVISGRLKAINSDMWVLRNIWDTEEQQEIVTSIVNRQLKQEEASDKDHPRAHRGNRPDPESITRDLEGIAEKLADTNCSESDKAFLKDRLALITERCEWIEKPEQRKFIQEQINAIWDSLEK